MLKKAGKIQLANHIKQIKKCKESVKSSGGKSISIFEILIPTNENLISSWAKHFREQYCADEELKALVEGTKYEEDKGKYLENFVFPSNTKPGPSLRSGDFSEVLIADYLEYFLSFWVPRNRLNHKATPDESIKGSDVIGLKFKVKGQHDPEDILAIFESKARLSAKSNNTLQDAIDHSGKDYFRLAHTLNATKRRYLQSKEYDKAGKIERFQNLEDNPFKEIFGAASFCTSDSLDDPKLFSVDYSNHPKKDQLKLLIFHGKDLMKLVHKLYKKAIDEA